MMSRRRMRSCKERWTVMCKDIVTQPKTLIVAAMVCLLLSLALMLWPDRAEAQQTATSHPGHRATSRQSRPLRRTYPSNAGRTA